MRGDAFGAVYMISLCRDATKRFDVLKIEKSYGKCRSKIVS
jgi:hypothetical protein